MRRPRVSASDGPSGGKGDGDSRDIDADYGRAHRRSARVSRGGRIAQSNARTGLIAFPCATARGPLEANCGPSDHRAREAPAMSARESWTRRGAQRPERDEAAPG